MNTQDTQNASNDINSLEAKAKAVIDALVDMGTSWADTGLGFGRTALENTSRSLEKTAKFLETVQEQLKKKPPTV